MSKHYSSVSEYCPISVHCQDKSNNGHQSYKTIVSEPSRAVLKIPRGSVTTTSRKRIPLLIERMAYQLSILTYLLQIVPNLINFCRKKTKRKTHILDTLLIHYIFYFTILVLIDKRVFVDCAAGGAIIKHRDTTLINELCKNFTQGNADKMEFASPLYGHEYPEEITCFRTITADHGYFVRIDFRDMFNVEPPSNEGDCKYDYLEIRDGDQGYSPSIGMILHSLNIFIIISPSLL